MSEHLQPDGMTEECANCYDVKESIKNNDPETFCLVTGYSKNEACSEMIRCKKCIWFWLDEVEVSE